MWRGGPVLVGTIRGSEEEVVVFSSGGVQLTQLNKRLPPRIPVLALIPAEGMLPEGSVTPSATCNPETNPGCGEGSGGGGSAVFGLFLTSWQIDDDYEGLLNGDPEFEVVIINSASLQGYSSSDIWRCVGEGFDPGSLRYWNYDDPDNFGSGQSLLLGTQDLSSTGFTSAVVLVTENDDASCTTEFPSINNPDPLANDDDFVGHILRAQFLPMSNQSFGGVLSMTTELRQF
jgi:hypothetical protein